MKTNPLPKSKQARERTSMPGISTKKRLIAIFAIFAFLFVLIIGRVGYLQIIQAGWLQQKALDQWTSDKPVSPRRGSILDRNGEVFAQSANADTVLLRPSQIEDADIVANKLAPILGMDEATIKEKASDKKVGELWLKRQITKDQANQIRSLNLKGVDFTMDMKRYYPQQNMLAQVIGFTSIDGNGLEGIEAQYNKYLAGVAGRIVEETDRTGKDIPLGGEVFVPPQNGYDVVLTADFAIQSFLDKACREAYDNNKAKSVQGIVMDVNTGEVLAMSNQPDYDLNAPPRDDIAKLQEVTRNRVVVDCYEPGSTFKVITLSSALNEKLINEDSQFTCVGYKMVDGEKIKCWRYYRPHGTQKLAQAVQNSCNPAFMEMALKLGKDKFYEYIYNFGFGAKTGIDYVSEEPGIVQHPKYVKNIDLARIGFGQSIAVTPLQLITGISAAVNGGKLMKPYLVKELRDENGAVVKEYQPTVVRNVISEETSQTVRTLLEGVVREGSGKNAYIQGYRVGGKTGTAQKYQNGQVMQGKSVASFIGFAPADNPKFAVLILVDEPDVAIDFGSVVAAPYVKTVIESTLKYMGIPPQNSDADASLVKTVEVPNVVGMDAAAAAAELEKAGLQCLQDGTGAVKSQLPGPTEKVTENTAVLLYTTNKDTSGDNTVGVPDLKGKTILEANAILKSLGLELKVNGSGIAVKQNLAKDTVVPYGTVIEVDFEPPKT